MRTAWLVGLATIVAGSPLAAQTPDSLRGRLSNDGVLRASTVVDSVFLDRTKPLAAIDGGDWASYLLARLDAGRIPDGLGIEILVDTARIVVRGRLQDLPPETRGLLGPVASMVDSSTMIVATVIMQRTGREVVRFWLRGLTVGGFPFPEFLLGSMMASIGRQYPALTATGRDLYVQVPSDGKMSLGPGTIIIAAPAVPTKEATPPRPRGID